MADTILEEIAAKTRERVAAAKRRVPPAEMERRRLCMLPSPR